MKKSLLVILFLFSSVSAFAQGGGSDASGGGNYLETKIRIGKSLAILALTTMSEKELDGFDLNHAQLEFYLRIRMPLAQDLSLSPLIFRPALMRGQFLLDRAGNKVLVSVETEEKTAMTKHMPQYPIEINMALCEELRMTEQGAAIFLMREGARHLGIQDHQMLAEVEAIGTVVVNKFLLRNSSLILENFQALKALDRPFIRAIPYSSIQPNQGEITHISEGMLHYYSANFNTEESELILATFKKTEEFLEGLGFPIHFEFRGELPKEVYDKNYAFAERYLKNNLYRKDTYNVIYHADFDSSYAFDNVLRGVESTVSQANIHGVWTNFDVGINQNVTTKEHSKKVKPYDDEEKYRPCLCTVVFKSLFRALSLNKVFPWVEQETSKPSCEHVHFEFLDQLSVSQVQALKEYLMTRVVFVQKPKIRLISENLDFAIYETEVGLLVKLKSSVFDDLHSNKLCMPIFRQSSFLWVDGLSRDPLIAHADVEDIKGKYDGSNSQPPTDGICFKPDHLSENPLLSAYTGGRLHTVRINEDFKSPAHLTIYVYAHFWDDDDFRYAVPERKYEVTIPALTFFKEGESQ